MSEPRLSEETGRFVLDELQRLKHYLSVSKDEADELLANATLWVLEHRDPQRPVTTTWLRRVLSVFQRRYLAGLRRHERVVIRTLPRSLETAPEGDATLLVEEIRQSLSSSEARVIERRLEGYEWKEALTELDVPAGSHSRWQKRIREKIGPLRKSWKQSRK